MPVKIAGTTYFSVEEIQRDHGVVRQSLWRWRKSGKVPKGLRYRGRQIVFTKREVDAIREYANRLEPTEAS